MKAKIKTIAGQLAANKQKILDILFVLYLLALLKKLLWSFIGQNYSLVKYNLSEFVINYRGGFVRRGLTGEILYFFVNTFHIDLIATTKILSFLLFCLLCIFFLKHFLKRGYSLYLLTMTFFLGALFNVEWYRKDCLILLCLAVACHTFNKIKPLAVKATLLNLVCIFAVLTHEVFGFFALPLLVLLLARDLNPAKKKQSCLRALLLLTPSVLAFFAAILCGGNADIAGQIFASWQPILHFDSIEQLPMLAYFKNGTAVLVKQNMDLAFLYMRNDGIVPFLAYLFLFPVIYYLLTNTLRVFRKKADSYSEAHRTALSALIIFQFCCFLPLFLFLSCDFGRLWLLISASSFIAFFSFSLQNITDALPSIFVRAANKINAWFDAVLYPRKATVALLLLFTGIPSLPWYVAPYIDFTPIYNILNFLSLPFRYIA